MVEHWFYHLEQSALDQILPDILEKTHAKGWRAIVKIGPLLGDPKDELTRLDEFLWTYKKDSFLPHGRDDEPMAGNQPVLLSTDCQSAGEADAVILIGGAELNDLDGVSRCITILDGADEQDKAVARTRWKLAKDAGLSTAYWKQDDYGKWEQPFK
ncbi:MAG: DNA polymerase III subunit chi [Rhodobacteraceae bacterium]|nr:DNA polymerase III subunit chi [Paracoccaceae bacterium]